jgi:hypothetical protein
MLMAASYVQKEMSKWPLPEAHRLAVDEMCESLIGAKHDIVNELGDAESMADEAGSARIGVIVERVQQWLCEEVQNMNKVVMSLQAASATDGSADIAFALVAGASVPVMDSYVVAAAAAKLYLCAASTSAD